MEYGEQFSSLHLYQARANKEDVPTLEEQDGLHQVQVECSRQRYDIDRASVLPVSIVSWETGVRIDSRSIKRGSQAGVSFALFGESSNLCIHSIIFLGCYLVLVHERI